MIEWKIIYEEYKRRDGLEVTFRIQHKMDGLLNEYVDLVIKKMKKLYDEKPQSQLMWTALIEGEEIERLEITDHYKTIGTIRLSSAELHQIRIAAEKRFNITDNWYTHTLAKKLRKINALGEWVMRNDDTIFPIMLFGGITFAIIALVVSEMR